MDLKMNQERLFTRCLAFLCVFLVTVALYHYAQSSTLQDQQTQGQHSRRNTPRNQKSNDNQHLPPVIERQSNNDKHRLLSSGTTSDSLLDRFERARQALYDQLRVDYGSDNFDKIFFTNTNNDNENKDGNAVPYLKPRMVIKPTSDQSAEQLVRRIARKLARAQLLGEHVPFVWATGGHSAAAGHGNFYRESYTAVMERSVGHIFKAVGIDFVGRNYAMGGTASGPEISACYESIFGVDVDVASWDFSMVDGRSAAQMTLYFYRAAMSLGRPACVGIDLGGGTGARLQALADLESRGVATFYRSEAVVKEAIEAFPKTFGLTTEEIDAMPTFVQSFVCQASYPENGDPTCARDKFNNTMCDKRAAKVKWHPGWKQHALTGNLLALYMLDLLEKAITLVMDHEDKLEELEQTIKSEEDVKHETLLKSPLPEIASQMLPFDLIDDFDAQMIWKKPRYCHTARLPAEIRYLGLLTGTVNDKDDEYKQAISKSKADAQPNESELMRLVGDDNRYEVCNETIKMDYKDYFYVNAKEGRKSLTLPNDAEAQYYKHEVLEGIFMVCLAFCSWGKCPAGDMNFSRLFFGEVEVTINNVKVIGVNSFGSCDILQHVDGFKFPANDQGKYVFAAKVHAPNSYIRFSSIVLW